MSQGQKSIYRGKLIEGETRLGAKVYFQGQFSCWLNSARGNGVYGESPLGAKSISRGKIIGGGIHRGAKIYFQGQFGFEINLGAIELI